MSASRSPITVAIAAPGSRWRAVIAVSSQRKLSFFSIRSC